MCSAPANIEKLKSSKKVRLEIEKRWQHSNVVRASPENVPDEYFYFKCFRSRFFKAALIVIVAVCLFIGSSATLSVKAKLEVPGTSVYRNLVSLREMVHAFEGSAYEAPFWAKNAHYHTILASGDAELLLGIRGNRDVKYIRERWRSPDGDTISLDFAAGEELTLGTDHDSIDKWSASVRSKREKGSAGRRLVILLHGLESSSTAPMTKRFVAVYTKGGKDVLAVNFRGCSDEVGSSNRPLGYHLGYTEDLRWILSEIHRRWPGLWERIYLSGFSLGASVVINFLGQEGANANAAHGVYGAAVGCVPFDPSLSVAQLESTLMGQYVYIPAFMGVLLGKVKEHMVLYPDSLAVDALTKIKSFSDINEHVILPLHNFTSLDEYYNTVDARNHINNVRVPLVVINARDDPMIAEESLPADAADAPVKLIYHDHGGHCGFLSASSSKKTDAKPDQVEGRWLPRELLRFIDHVDSSV